MGISSEASRLNSLDRWKNVGLFFYIFAEEMKREQLIRVLAGVMLAVFGSVAVTLPVHLSSSDHVSGLCDTSSTSTTGCLFLQFLTETFAEGEWTPEVTEPQTPAVELCVAPTRTLSSVSVTLPALRAPPFSLL